MTVLDNDVNLTNKSLSHSRFRASYENLKRKCTVQEDIVPVKRALLLKNTMNGYRSDQRNNGDTMQESPVATLSNMGNTCYLNSVLYSLRFAPNFLHNLHHLIGDLSLVNNRLSQHKAKTSSLGRNIGAIMGPSSRSTSSKDLLALGSSSEFIPKSKVQIVTEKLHELFMTMHSFEMKDSTDPYQPIALLQAVRDANTIFEGNHQQDAHELLLYLLDNIRETCQVLANQVHSNPDLLNESEPVLPSNSSSKLLNIRRSWKASITKKNKNSPKETVSEDDKLQIKDECSNGSVITDTEDTDSVGSNSDNNRKKIGYNFLSEDFEGITLRRTKCLECESVTERKEPFYDIPVPISVKDDNNPSMEQLSPSDIYRKACVTSEKLCDANKYLCEKCDRYNEASRDVRFERLPNLMVLQLKRFTSSNTGVQKITDYVPTPMMLDCFCESCCNLEVNQEPSHSYKLCCVIMHLGGSMASGHYIAYVKASSHLDDYNDCSRELPKTSLSASSSEKSVNILKFLKPKSVSNSLVDTRNGFLSKGTVNGMKLCKSVECCGVRLNRNVIENAINSYAKKNGQEILHYRNSDMWLECDDESVRCLTSDQMVDLLGCKPSSTSTPYLLFYSKISRSPQSNSD